MAWALRYSSSAWYLSGALGRAALDSVLVGATRRRKHWGWGFEDQQPTPAEVRVAAPALAEQLGMTLREVEEPVALESVTLSPPRIAAPASLAEICAGDDHARASHALGKSYSDVVRGFRGRFDHPPTLSPTRAMSTIWKDYSSGVRASAWRRSRSAEARRSSAG